MKNNKKICSLILVFTFILNISGPYIGFGENLENKNKENIDVKENIELEVESNKEVDEFKEVKDTNEDLIDKEDESNKSNEIEDDESKVQEIKDEEVKSENSKKTSEINETQSMNEKDIKLIEELDDEFNEEYKTKYNMNYLKNDIDREFNGGDGTKNNPYIISTGEQLNNVRKYPEAYFKQDRDINLQSSSMDGGNGWRPIGSLNEPFIGGYDGNGCEINRLYINRTNEDNVGLFGVVGESAFFKNIKLNGVAIVGGNITGGLIGETLEDSNIEIKNCSVGGNITGKKWTGGLIGHHQGGKVEDSSVKVNVSGSGRTGGLIGESSGKIYRCNSDGNVVSSELNTGGLVGKLESKNGIVIKSYSESNVKNNYRNNTGGLVGYIDKGLIKESYATGQIQGNQYVGGLVGKNDNGTIEKSKATGDVEGSIHVGGLVGLNDGNIMISNSSGDVEGTFMNSYVGGFVGKNRGMVSQSYSLGDVEGINIVGGFIGQNSENKGISISESYSAGKVKVVHPGGPFLGSQRNDRSMIVDNYYDSVKSGIKEIKLAGVTSKTTIEMMKESTYENWDFNYTWDIDEGSTYPIHKWEKDEPEIPEIEVKLNLSSIKLNVGGETIKLIATIYPANSSYKNIKWSSQNESIAIVDSNGNVSAVGVGETEILAEVEGTGKTGKCKVQVNEKIKDDEDIDDEDIEDEDIEDEEDIEKPELKPGKDEEFGEVYKFNELVLNTEKFNKVLESYTSNELKVIVPSLELISIETIHNPNILTNFKIKTGNKVREIKLEFNNQVRTATRVKTDVFNCDWAGLERGAEIIITLYDGKEIEVGKKVIRLKEGTDKINYGEKLIEPGNYTLLNLLSNPNVFNEILSSHSMINLKIGAPIRYITDIKVNYGAYVTSFSVQTFGSVDRVTILTPDNQEVNAHSQGRGLYTADVSGLSLGSTVKVLAYDLDGNLIYEKLAFVD